MPKKARQLSSKFSVESYKLELLRNPNGQIVSGRVLISGKKIGPPSKRLVFHQKGLKITGAVVTKLDKKGDFEIEVARTNHLSTFSEVRIHTKDLLYPGHYQVDLAYELSPQKAKSFKERSHEIPHRDLLPCIDEPEAWDNASFEIK